MPEIKDIIYVHAGNPHQANLLAIALDVEKSLVQYVDDEYVLHGLEEGTFVYFAGTYWEHKNHHTILKYIIGRKLQVVFSKKCYGWGIKATK